ncbi:TadE/TadG family type IV pilus assembly protein [Lederbergia citri]|uniref:Pilus assembly protein n=1 Tax=Lederbergia citri TaxID=2833580 RepID=A0A942YI68_9BACI|nr:TadE/TadG family type IV pilus assembly protein [Lederbergia citri]MBS4196145.1 pilus assembly protein [Lederbergia citri]
MKKVVQMIARILKEQRGVAMILVALGMFMLIGFTAFVVDVGSLYYEKSRLQKALDAGVLGGAQVLIDSETKAKDIAIKITNKNGENPKSGKRYFTVTDDDVTTEESFVKIDKTVNKQLTFAKLIGFNQATVSASAKAIVGPLKSAKGIAPIAVEKNSVPNGTKLTCTGNEQNNSDNNSPGNCGFLSVDGTGAPAVKKALTEGKEYSVDSEVELGTEPGKMNGPIGQAIDDLIKSDKDKPHCQSASTADNSCKRVIYIVIIDSWEAVKGRDKVKVEGLASFWVEDYKDKSIIGHFINTVTAGEVGEPGSGYEYGLYGVKLVD